jgi:uncharacterized LabA/DUF88 family protein
MQVIADYNNIPDAIRRRGLKYLAEKIALTLGPTAVGKYRRLHIRLYDGWYQVQRLTHLAQSTSAELQREFPTTITLPSPHGTAVRAVVAAEMAYSLHCDPTMHIWHTFRPRSGQSNVSCKSPASAGCTSRACVLSELPRFFATQQCPEASCTISAEDLIVRNEQKLVDSMMATDLMSLHLTSSEELVVVSSDDDLWPAIRLLLQRGHTVYHIHTKPNRATPPFYSQRIPDTQYIQLHL